MFQRVKLENMKRDGFQFTPPLGLNHGGGKQGGGDWKSLKSSPDGLGKPGDLGKSPFTLCWKVPI